MTARTHSFAPDAPDRSRPDEHHIQDLIDEARSVLDILENGVAGTRDKPGEIISLPALLELVKAERSRTGFPAAQGRAPGPPSSMKDDEGVPMPPLSDPVGELVVGAGRDELRIMLGNVLRGLRGAVGDLRAAHSALARATPPPPVAEPGCKVLARFGVWEPVYRGERCRWVYDWWLANGADPPDMIVKARLEGRRITNKLVDEALAAQRQPKKSRRKNRRRGAA